MKDREKDCNCCKGWARYVCSLLCALVALAQQRQQRVESSDIAYRGEGFQRMPGCDMRAHYDQLQAMGDALGYAAQKVQSGFIEQRAQHQRNAGAHLQGDENASAQRAVHRARAAEMWSNYWYGVFQGVRGFLRALEGNTSELHQIEQDMLKRIDWDAQRPHFVVPGFEDVRLEDQHLPGDEPVGEASNAPVG
jgi:hypothetical protein